LPGISLGVPCKVRNAEAVDDVLLDNQHCVSRLADLPYLGKNFFDDFGNEAERNYTATAPFLVMAATVLRDCNPFGISADKQTG
jgi:hypothetical protein